LGQEGDSLGGLKGQRKGVARKRCAFAAPLTDEASCFSRSVLLGLSGRIFNIHEMNQAAFSAARTETSLAERLFFIQSPFSSYTAQYAQPRQMVAQFLADGYHCRLVSGIAKSGGADESQARMRDLWKSQAYATP
jgi:hypothetical protein